jgi:Cu/Ag efflux protein CusF
MRDIEMAHVRVRQIAGIVMLGWALAAPPTVRAQGRQGAGGEHTFRGRVEQVNAQAGTMIVNGENVEGWMAAMTMTYKVDAPPVLTNVKAGDTITATVRDGDFATLYNVKVEASAGANDVVPISYVCLTPGEESFVNDRPGKCLRSGAALVPVRLVIAYSCLRNQVFTREEPGRCPTDGTQMVPITVAMFYVCKNDPNVHATEPGKCSDGSERTKAYDRRPHGDHNPRHGGDAIFMSADQWHHLEGTFVQSDVFRLYLYDAMTRPLAASGVTGRLVMADSNAREIGPSIPLTPASGADKSRMEAGLPKTPFPLNVKLFMTFKPGEKEQVFDFTFRGYSVEP